jgi:ferredoxin
VAEVPVYLIVLEWAEGRTKRLEVAADETVVGAAEAASLGLLYGCLYDACGTYTARVLDGAVRHRRLPRALKDRHQESGCVLPCVATPTNCRLRVGADVQAELVENPWK